MTLHPGFEEFYQREFDPVFRTAYLLSGDRALAEDATQEAFVRALERWRRLAGEPWAGGWVTSTATNLIRRALRRRKPPLGPGEQVGNDTDAAIDLWRRIKALPVRQQQAVLLFYGADLAVAEVARAMGCEEGTARAHLARARGNLRNTLEGEDDGERRADPLPH